MPNPSFDQAVPLVRRAAEVRTAATRCPADREDLVQECLIACWSAWRQFDSTRSGPRTFCERVVTNRLVSLHRSRCRRPRHAPLAGHLTEEDRRLWRFELRADVVRALAAVGRQDRMLASALAELSPSQTSQLLGLSRPAIYRAIGRLRQAFVAAGLQPKGWRP
jgi:RNA polymerase sigma factor (sigma-70 family)